METLLLLRPDRNGDAIKTLPVIRALVDQVSNPIELHLLCSSRNASLFLHEPNLHRHVWSGEETACTAISSLPSRFDKVINLLCDFNQDADALMKMIPAHKKYSVRCSGWGDGIVETLTLPANSPAGNDETSNIALIVSQALQIPVNPEGYSAIPIFSDADEREAREKMGSKVGRWLGLCPFAGELSRSHALKRWEKFITKVVRDTTFSKFFLLGAPSDSDRLETIQRHCQYRDGVEILYPSSFRTLGAYLKRVDGVIAVDSGPLHLALSLGIKALGLLSGGDIQRWFNHPKAEDLLLPRGLLRRFPSTFEMRRAFERWKEVAMAH